MRGGFAACYHSRVTAARRRPFRPRRARIVEAGTSLGGVDSLIDTAPRSNSPGPLPPDLLRFTASRRGRSFRRHRPRAEGANDNWIRESRPPCGGVGRVTALLQRCPLRLSPQGGGRARSALACENLMLVSLPLCNHNYARNLSARAWGGMGFFEASRATRHLTGWSARCRKFPGREQSGRTYRDVARTLAETYGESCPDLTVRRTSAVLPRGQYSRWYDGAGLPKGVRVAR